MLKTIWNSIIIADITIFKEVFHLTYLLQPFPFRSSRLSSAIICSPVSFIVKLRKPDSVLGPSYFNIYYGRKQLRRCFRFGYITKAFNLGACFIIIWHCTRFSLPRLPMPPLSSHASNLYDLAGGRDIFAELRLLLRLRSRCCFRPTPCVAKREICIGFSRSAP